MMLNVETSVKSSIKTTLCSFSELDAVGETGVLMTKCSNVDVFLQRCDGFHISFLLQDKLRQEQKPIDQNKESAFDCCFFCSITVYFMSVGVNACL